MDAVLALLLGTLAFLFLMLFGDRPEVRGTWLGAVYRFVAYDFCGYRAVVAVLCGRRGERAVEGFEHCLCGERPGARRATGARAFGDSLTASLSPRQGSRTPRCSCCTWA